MSRWRRALLPGRWDELRGLFESFAAAGYRIVGLEDWVGEPAGSRPPGRELVVRFDVDQHPRSARRVLRLHRELGLSPGTWYLRWRTAEPRLVDALRAAGHGVGLHFETLTRRALRTGRAPGPGDVEACREELLREIALFRERFGPLRSICAHGDTRVPGVRNLDLVDDALLERAEVAFEANLAIPSPLVRGRLTDRPAGRGWSKGVTPEELIERGTTPIACLLHPNNWAAPLAVRLDMLVRRRSDEPG